MVKGRKRKRRTNKPPRRPVPHGVQQAHEAAGVPDGLAEPEHGLGGAAAAVLGGAGVLGQPLRLVRRADGEHEQQRQRGPRHERQQLRLRDRVHVVHGQRAAEAQPPEEPRHHFRVRLQRDEGRSRGVRRRVRVRYRRGGHFWGDL